MERLPQLQRVIGQLAQSPDAALAMKLPTLMKDQASTSHGTLTDLV